MSQSKKHNLDAVKDFCDRLKEKVYTKVGELSGEAYVTPEPLPYAERTSGEYLKLKVGEKWGNLFDCAWMHFTGTVPPEAAGKKVVLILDVAGEGLVVDEDGNPKRGLTTRASDFDGELGGPVKRVLQFLPCAKGGEPVDIWMDAACNDLFGKYCENGVLLQADISTCNDVLRHYYYDFYYLCMLCEAMPEDGNRRARLLSGLLASAKVCDTYSDEELERADAILRPLLAEKNTENPLTVWAVGHAHLDLAWLWPLRETKRKGARTFATVLELMDRYRDYYFGGSQPQLYQWMKDLYPALYARVKEKIREGRWECQGAMWVEPDMNLTGSEAMVRQILYGKKFFMDEFGKDMRVLWLPDVFGYSAALPQVLLKSGVPYFMTIKLSWSEHNQFPHHTFLWKGIDGSEVLAHMPPEGNYNSSARPKAILNNETEFKDKGASNDVLMLFGIGDGGGGPGTEHLEMLERDKSVAGLPNVQQRPAVEFFDKINNDRPKLAHWSGELYLEKHQGTYTTQSNNKKYNRLMELRLRDCEFICSLARLYAGYEYPQDELETIWKEVLLYQFHDILPGSSIKRVYDESVPRYQAMLARVEEIIREASDAFAASVGGAGGKKLCINTQPFAREGELGEGVYGSVAAYGWSVAGDAAQPQSDVKNDGDILENSMVRVRLDADGNIVSFYDKQAGRETINSKLDTHNLVIYEDGGDCWDIDFTYADKAPATLRAQKVEREGGSVKYTYQYHDSSIVQTITLAPNSKKLVFHTDVEWKETHRMLRARYPMDIQTDEALCNIQFGYVKRPTHQNTSWDYAKFEVCAHKWISVSEPGYGAALINNCKYGFKVWDNVLDINLLRSPMYPGENADKGSHHFDYALLLHDGDVGQVNREAYLFNSPAVLCPAQEGGKLPAEGAFLQIDKPNVIAEALKLSEDKAGYILRLYESEGRFTHANIRVSGLKGAQATDMIERIQDTLPVEGEGITLTFKPFEIHTVKLAF